MRKALFALAVALFLSFMVPALSQAADICEQDTVPYYPSYNSSMLLIIPTDEVSSWMAGLSVPLEVKWELSDSITHDPLDWGSMNKFGDCYVCEFSSSPSFDASCGPTPFTHAGSYDMEFFANDISGDAYFNRTGFTMYPKTIESITINIIDNDVHVNLYAPMSVEASVNLYDAQTGKLLDVNLSVDASVYTGAFLIAILDLPVGEYYAEFGTKTSTGARGGSLSKFEIAPADVELEVSTDKTKYWIGESVVITGKTKYAAVSGSVNIPGGTTIPLERKAVTDGEFMYEFPLLKSYAPGNYTITMETTTATDQATIEVRKLFDIDNGKDKLALTLGPSETVEQNITISNEVNASITLAATVEDIGDYVDARFTKNTIGGNSATDLMLSIDPSGLTGTKTGKILVSSAAYGVVIPIDVSLTVQAGPAECPPVEAGELEVSPALWVVDECLAGETLNRTFTIKNNGDSDMTSFSYKATDIEVEGYDFPDKLVPGVPGSLELSVRTGPSGKASGSVQIKGGDSTQDVYISLSCAVDKSVELDLLQSDVDSLKSSFEESGFSDTSVGFIFSPIDEALDSSSEDMNSGDYALAEQEYLAASSMYQSLSAVYSEIGSAGGDSSGATGVIVILVIALVGVVGFLVYDKLGGKLFKKAGSQPSGEGGEETYEEELY